MSVSQELTAGSDLPPLVRSPSTEDLVRYAQSSNDHARLHYDHHYAVERGFDGVIVHGALKAAYMGQVLTDWVAERGWVAEFRAEFRGPDRPGTELTARGRIRSVERIDDADHVTVDLWVEGTEGRVTTRGHGVAILDRR